MKVSKALNGALTNFWGVTTSYRNIKPSRYKVLYGGRASSKSHELCTMLILMAYKSKIRVLCTRAFQVKISDSVMALLTQKIDYLGLNQFFRIQRSKITCKNGSEFLFYGLARNTEEIKGLEDIDICYVEEGQYITKDMFDILAPTIRKEGSEIWIAFNPKSYYDFVYQEFVLKDKPNRIVRKINYNENPFLSQTMKDEIESLKDEEGFSNIYLGEPTADDSQSVFKREWLEVCINAYEVLKVLRDDFSIIGYDVADIGNDTNAIVLNDGGEITRIEEWHGKENELDKSTKRAISFFPQHSKSRHVNYDSIGVGAGVGVFLRVHKHQKEVETFSAFVASAKVNNPRGRYKVLGSATQIFNEDYFQNSKAQQWIYLADRAKATYNAITQKTPIKKEDILSFSASIKKSKIDELFKQLTQPKKEEQSERKIKIESKKDLLKRGIPSPNLADALIMATIKKRKSF